MAAVFQRRTSGSVVCPSCGSLVGVRDDKCYNCGRSNPGLWGFAPLLRQLGRRPRLRPARHRHMRDHLPLDAALDGAQFRRQMAALLRRLQHSRAQLASPVAVRHERRVPGFRIGLVVDAAQRQLAPRQPAAHRVQHDVGARSRSRDGRHRRSFADGHHLHVCRRLRVPAQLDGRQPAHDGRLRIRLRTCWARWSITAARAAAA